MGVKCSRRPRAIDDSYQMRKLLLGHARTRRDLTPHERQWIVDFESGLFTEQALARLAGNLGVQGASGRPERFSKQQFLSVSTTR